MASGGDKRRWPAPPGHAAEDEDAPDEFESPTVVDPGASLPWVSSGVPVADEQEAEEGGFEESRTVTTSDAMRQVLAQEKEAAIVRKATTPPQLGRPLGPPRDLMADLFGDRSIETAELPGSQPLAGTSPVAREAPLPRPSDRLPAVIPAALPTRAATPMRPSSLRPPVAEAAPAAPAAPTAPAPEAQWPVASQSRRSLGRHAGLVAAFLAGIGVGAGAVMVFHRSERPAPASVPPAPAVAPVAESPKSIAGVQPPNQGSTPAARGETAPPTPAEPPPKTEGPTTSTAPAAAAPTPGPAGPLVAQTDGDSSWVLVQLTGPTNGFKFVRMTKPPGVIARFPRARTVLKPGVYAPGGPFSKIRVVKQGPGTVIAVGHRAGFQASVKLEGAAVRIDVRR